MGRTDNIAQGYELLLALLLQTKTAIYDPSLTKTVFRNNQNIDDALNTFISFSLLDSPNYSWNQFLADPNSSEKDLAAFALGKVSTIPGFAFTYDALINEINRQKSLGQNTIAINDVRSAPLPQLIDTNTSSETKVTYSSYFVPVVSRTTQKAEIAWDFLATLASDEQLRGYLNLSKRPSAKRSLIGLHQNDPIYSSFESQVGYAKSLPVYDYKGLEILISEAIDRLVNQNAATDETRRTLAEQLDTITPNTGIKPVLLP